MFFIFGWGKTNRKDYGPTYPITCPKCHNDNYWHLLNTKTWFSLFFIPVIPYEYHNYLLCPICSNGIELNRVQTERAKILNNQTSLYLENQISEEEYTQDIEESRLLE